MLVDGPATLGWDEWRALDAKHSMRLLRELPPTYKEWLKEYADGAYFELGSALRLFSLEEKKENELTVLSQTDAFRSMEHCDLKELVVFGCNGVAVTADQIVHLAKQLNA